jgi:AGZA family xanthine/uracil permease-like MFS transporter
MLKRLEIYFEFTRLGTNWRTEILAGVTTFLTMAYIVLVNPAILSAAGMPLAAVTAATCLSTAFGSILMGVVARYPIALAPGMGLNAYFMLATINEIPWNDPLVAVPSFLTLILIPLTYSIANGLGLGIISWAVLHLVTGRFRRQDWLLYILAALFLARFVYLGAS